MFLQDLPSDLLTYLIQTSIDPIDIISLRKVRPLLSLSTSTISTDLISHLNRHAERSTPQPTPALSGDLHSIAHATHTVSSHPPSPSTPCLHDNLNQPHSRHGASPRSWTLHPPTTSPPRARACLTRMEVCSWMRMKMIVRRSCSSLGGGSC